jgi:sec-independent protein translocase protein TatC
VLTLVVTPFPPLGATPNMLVHLIELRRRLLYVACCFIGLFLLFFYKSADLYHLLVAPLLHLLPQQSLIATHITAPVFTPLKLAADTALMFTVPFALYQLWVFISPGLYQKEQQQIQGLVSISLVLFAIGVLFCFYVILPSMYQLFISATPKDVRLMPDITHTIEFITHMLLVFGLCFQVPLLCLIFVRLQWVSVETLKQIRPYIIVVAFIIGMLLTPPDVLSQIMLAVPLCILYELGIILARYGC